MLVVQPPCTSRFWVAFGLSWFSLGPRVGAILQSTLGFF